MLELYKVSSGIYQTTDDLFQIKKIDTKWSWFMRSGSAWVAKDKRKYRTKTHCERCIYAEVDRYKDDINYDIQLWEG